MPHDDFRSGFIALIGLPNVGKSTLMNRILGQKVAITSPRPQTTRNRILGIHTLPNAQLLFIDTPGIHHARGKLHRFMVGQAYSTLEEVDVVLLLTEANRQPVSDELKVLERLAQRSRPVVLVLNKIDMVSPPQLLGLIDDWQQRYEFAEIIPVSAETGDGTAQLLDLLLPRLPIGSPHYPEDQLTDLPERFVVAEMIREKVMRFTRQEVPFGTAVQVEQFVEQEGSPIEIHAVVHVARETHKRILVGKGGSMIKQIGTSARKEIEMLLGTKVFLKLFVRVERNWTESDRLLKEFGYH